MRTSFGRVRLLLGCLVGATLLVVLAVGCQTYDFEPVQPLAIGQKTQTRVVTAKQLKPDLMLLVDKSGSMDEPADPSVPACGLPDGGVCGVTGAPACPTNTCPTRWSSLQDAMGQFLTNSGTIARMGLGFFPDVTGGQCGPTTGISVPLAALADGGATDDDTTLSNFAQQIDATINGATPAGGTPTSLSLAFIGQQYQTYQTTNRENFILLLTDGLPNCNPSNPYTYASNPVACQCTTSNCSPADPTAQHEVCLDEDATVKEITDLASTGIKTIVVGFGAETATGNAPQVLTAMANAGGFPRDCSDAGSGCTPYYQASSANDLASALAAIGASIAQGDPCVFQLDSPPSDPSLLAVFVNGQLTDPGANTWCFGNDCTPAAPGAVVFQGTLCQQIDSSTPANPVQIEIRAVQSL